MILSVIAFLLLSAANVLAAPSTPHPLDPLSKGELATPLPS
jgi:hypothetical protein